MGLNVASEDGEQTVPGLRIQAEEHLEMYDKCGVPGLGKSCPLYKKKKK